MSDDDIEAPRETAGGGLDPELASLLAVEESQGGKPSFDSLFEEPPTAEEEADGAAEEGERPRDGFPAVAEFEAEPEPIFRSKEYYPLLLGGEGDLAKELHRNLAAFITAKENSERSKFRERLLPQYWELYTRIATHHGADAALPKRMLLRLGLLSPSLISREQLDAFSRVILEDRYGEPVYYSDEWLNLVRRGEVNPSGVDETSQGRKGGAGRAEATLEKRKGQYEAQQASARQAAERRETLERQLKEQAGTLGNHEVLDDHNVPAPYSAAQRQALGDLAATTRDLSAADKELQRSASSLDQLLDQVTELEGRTEGGDRPSGGGDSSMVAAEAATLRQMAKMCVGRMGNHFPFLLKQYAPGSLRDVATRENVIAMLTEIEGLDPELFFRTFKGTTQRIVPNVLLLPCYGDIGICWEPFEKHNRATSRGRMALPMYGKDLRSAMIAALADLRWQVAKERAQHYWMEEGLTGEYYQWFTAKKLKGDVKDQFVQDYALWLTWEKDGVQKLDKDVRAIFWRKMPFPPEVKDGLRTRGYAYAELLKKDKNRALSDGY